LALVWPLLSAFTVPELQGTAQVTVRPPAGECCTFSGTPASLRFVTDRSHFAPNGVRLVAGLQDPQSQRTASLILDLDLSNVPPQGSTTYPFPTTASGILSYNEEEGGSTVFYTGTVYGHVVLTPATQLGGGYLFSGLAEVTCVAGDGTPGASRGVLVSFSFGVPPHESWGYAGAIGVGIGDGGCGGDVDPGQDDGEGCGRGNGYDSNESGCGGDDSDGSRSDCSGSDGSGSGSSDCGGAGNSGGSGGSDSHCGMITFRGDERCPADRLIGAPCKKRRPRTPLRMAPYFVVFLGIALLRRRVRARAARPE
jgi:hypothetical protein